MSFIVLPSLIACAVAQQALLWPWPQHITWAHAEVIIDINTFTVTIAADSFVDSTLQAAVKRYSASLLVNQGNAKPWPQPTIMLKGVAVTVLSKAVLQSGVNESYYLSVPADGRQYVNITAETVYGALHAFETLSQLIRVGPARPGSTVLAAAAAGCEIFDFPRFEYRGFLFDSSRHFLSVHTLLKIIDALAINKFNVFHWHIVDDESFPFDSQVLPNLAKQGAYAYPSHAYLPAHVQLVIAHAAERGVRVMPEFDTPGHTLSWGDGYPYLLTPCYRNGRPDGKFGPLNPIDPTTYAFVSKLFTEVASVFPESFLHLGGDEVPFQCWQSNPEIVAFMAAKNFTNYSDLENYYIAHIYSDVARLNKVPLVWEEMFTNGVKLTRNTIVDVWKNTWQVTLSAVTLAGYRAILSNPWYLNYISYGKNWVNYYQVEPQKFAGTAAQHALMIGGEATMWGEFVDDTNVLARSWPRGSAVGERLWSARDVRDVSSATLRLADFTCRMILRGIPAEPPNGAAFCDIEWQT